MVVCDRCGCKMDKSDLVSITIYKQAGAYSCRHVDLCDKCKSQLKNLTDKLESYFMVNKENPESIFIDVKYWNGEV